MQYRREIDGLRAIAVLGVVLYHAGAWWIPGGFIGVDVFFVISGFLITNIIVKEVAEGAFSIGRFYERRARRILPALFFMLIVCLVLVRIVGLPEHVESTSVSALAALLFSSNFYFWGETGYFAPSTEFMPLLHTWSLAVEEQFYLLFPLFIVWMHRLKHSILLMVTMSLLPLFAASVWLSYAKPSFAFYLLPARAWELCLGAFVAVAWGRLNGMAFLAQRSTRDVLSGLGLVLVIVSMVTLTSETVFPGWVAILPCVGCALVLAFGHETLLVNKALSTAPMRFFGKISYSLYLWHWPVLVFFRMYVADITPDLSIVLISVALSIILATLSWLYVEEPFRRSSPETFRLFFASLTTTAMVIVGFSAYGITRGQSIEHLPPPVVSLLSAEQDVDPVSEACHKQADGFDRGGVCRFGSTEGEVKFAVLGDSHAGAARAVVLGSQSLAGKPGVVWWFGGCPYLPDVRRTNDAEKAECLEFKAQAFEELKRNTSLTHVILMGRWAAARTGTFPEIGGSYRAYLADNETTELTAAQTEATFDRAIKRAVSELRAMGKVVILLGALPEPGFDVPRVLALGALNGRNHSSDMTAQKIQSRAALGDAPLIALAKQIPGVYFIPLWDAFCNGDVCPLIVGGRSVYRDDDHITYSAAQIVAARIGPQLESVVQKSTKHVQNGSLLNASRHKESIVAQGGVGPGP